MAATRYRPLTSFVSEILSSRACISFCWATRSLFPAKWLSGRQMKTAPKPTKHDIPAGMLARYQVRRGDLTEEIV